MKINIEKTYYENEKKWLFNIQFKNSKKVINIIAKVKTTDEYTLDEIIWRIRKNYNKNIFFNKDEDIVNMVKDNINNLLNKNLIELKQIKIIEKG